MKQWPPVWTLKVWRSQSVRLSPAPANGAQIATHEALPPVAHGFTHFRLDIEPHRLGVARVAPRAAAPGAMWLPLEDALGAAIPAPVKRILAALATGKSKK